MLLKNVSSNYQATREVPAHLNPMKWATGMYVDQTCRAELLPSEAIFASVLWSLGVTQPTTGPHVYTTSVQTQQFTKVQITVWQPMPDGIVLLWSLVGMYSLRFNIHASGVLLRR